ncbi:S8 family serine peptidase [Streptosporangium sp. NPDC001559]|uniref:S8 family serine peptidase n=1 Tax=Streptosporangium sp. NPDC001559 TaxID=3366187 RepID=UPI0036F08A75
MTITLITGDRVTLTPSGYRVRPGKGREKVAFVGQRHRGHLFVFPSDAHPLVERGLVDERLFDVTQLAAWNYDDAHRQDVPVLVRSGGKTTPSLTSAKTGWRSRELKLAAMKVTKAKAVQAWGELSRGAEARALGEGVSKLWLDGRLSLDLDQSVPQIGAPAAWQRGLTGKGVKVAVLDSGYDSGHPDLKDVVTQTRNFGNDPDPEDRTGHGTHVTSIIAGSGAASGGRYRGVAPDVRVAVGKVVNKDRQSIDESAVLAAMEWAATEVGAKVINMSLSGPDDYGDDPMEEALNTLSADTGALFVNSAGNSGPGESTLGTPGTADAALTVGMVDKSGAITPRSSRGPRVGDLAVKPDITAPGADITAARSQLTSGTGFYTAKTGTSMSAPHVAGAAALLAQEHPDWNGERIKGALIGSATRNPALSAYDQGTGLVNVDLATSQRVSAAPGNVWLVLPSPNGETATRTRTVTYANAGDQPVTLNLALEPAKAGGTLPTGLLGLSASTLTVPAGGEASVTLTASSAGVPAGAYPGALVATAAGGARVRTLAGAYVEPEAHDVTINLINRVGPTPLDADVTVYDLKGRQLFVPLVDGQGRARLTAGQWYVGGRMRDVEGGTTVFATALTVDHDQTVTLDGRQAKEVTFSADDPTAVMVPYVRLKISHRQGENEFHLVETATQGAYVIPATVPGLVYQAADNLVKEGARFSPYRYDLVDRREGGLPADPAHRVVTGSLARVVGTYRAAGTQTEGTASAGSPDFDLPGSPVAMPGTLTSYRTPNLVWDSRLQYGELNSVEYRQPGVLLPPGSYEEVWNSAVFGPDVTGNKSDRTGDRLSYELGMTHAEGGPGRGGADDEVTGTATLSKDGTVIERMECDPGFDCRLTADLPAATGVYTLTERTTRNVTYASLSTSVEATWTFHSGHTADEQPLPLLGVRMTPVPLDDLNRAGHGRRTHIPMTFVRAAGHPVPNLTSLKVEASFDDGATWQQAQSTFNGNGAVAQVDNPSSGDFVSLRVTAVDGNGDTLTQTVLRAYGLTG